jgi:hypothetical protein
MVRIHVGQPLFPRKSRLRLTPAQILPGSEPPKMKFPKVIRHRKAEVTIYGKKKNYPFYRIAYRVAGKRHLRNYSKYGEALKEAEKKVREIDSGSQAAALTAVQSRDALAAFQRLETLQNSIGRRVSLLSAVSEYAEAITKSHGRNLCEIVEIHQRSNASVNRKDYAFSGARVSRAPS